LFAEVNEESSSYHARLVFRLLQRTKIVKNVVTRMYDKSSDRRYIKQRQTRPKPRERRRRKDMAECNFLADDRSRYDVVIQWQVRISNMHATQQG